MCIGEMLSFIDFFINFDIVKYFHLSNRWYNIFSLNVFHTERDVFELNVAVGDNVDRAAYLTIKNE